MNKKASVVAAVIVIVLIIVIIIVSISRYTLRECSGNEQCDEMHYCGSDFKCHEYPSNPPKPENMLIIPAIILGLALIIAAYTYRNKKLPFA